MEGIVGDFVNAEMAEESDIKGATQERGSEGWGRVEWVGRNGRERVSHQGMMPTSLCPLCPLTDFQPSVPAVLYPSVSVARDTHLSCSDKPPVTGS